MANIVFSEMEFGNNCGSINNANYNVQIFFGFISEMFLFQKREKKTEAQRVRERPVKSEPAVQI